MSERQHKDNPHLLQPGSRLNLLQAMACALLLCACSTNEERRPPDVESGRPDWTREQGDVAPIRPARPARRAAPQRPAEEASPYRESTPEALATESELHRQSLLGSDATSLHPNEVGYYVDTLEARLVQVLRNSDIRWSRQGNTLSLLFDGDTFASNKATLSAKARTDLAPVAAILEEYDRTRVTVLGHTDNVGDEEYNRRLSVRRARAIADLLSEAGVASERLFIVGYGESSPVKENTTERGRAANRRIELIVEPLERALSPPAGPEPARD